MEGFFARTRPGATKSAGSTTFELPILYFRDDCFALFFTADRARVTQQMPSDRLFPVCATASRAFVGIAVFNYIDTTIGSYGEVAIVVPAVWNRRPLPILPALLEGRYPGFGMVVLHLPVTTAVARDAGRSVWGYPKFVADMEFEMTPELGSCELTEGGQQLMSIRVPRRGILVRDNRPLVTYSTRGGDLVRTTIRQRSVYRVGLGFRGVQFALGSHPVASELAALGISSRPVVTRFFLERSAILAEGEVVARNVARPLNGFSGAQAAGVHTVRYLTGI
ncbi:MAG: acetoacetate decarboxylase family protein [Candidatus Schekmanbacteria bacterium]|nr:acetoacetate decarboxylase family protein [Candidatus Schekmanbacteria bacterium]